MTLLRTIFRLVRWTADHLFPQPAGWQPSRKRNDTRFK